jgi:hypothetical protein
MVYKTTMLLKKNVEELRNQVILGYESETDENKRITEMNHEEPFKS